MLIYLSMGTGFQGYSGLTYRYLKHLSFSYILVSSRVFIPYVISLFRTFSISDKLFSFFEVLESVC